MSFVDTVRSYFNSSVEFVKQQTNVLKNKFYALSPRDQLIVQVTGFIFVTLGLGFTAYKLMNRKKVEEKKNPTDKTEEKVKEVAESSFADKKVKDLFKSEMIDLNKKYHFILTNEEKVEQRATNKKLKQADKECIEAAATFLKKWGKVLEKNDDAALKIVLSDDNLSRDLVGIKRIAKIEVPA